MVKDKAWRGFLGAGAETVGLEGSLRGHPVHLLASRFNWGASNVLSSLGQAVLPGKMQSSYIYPKKGLAIIPAPYPGQSLTLFED